ncbi:MAG: transposase [Planctomycetes bacterium GWC2_45_44]|nr:MAG: transposase [Planctomycetes bacterium GWC2_45_44]
MQNAESAQSDKNLNNVIKINETKIQEHLGQMVRSTVEETLNAMLDAEADQLCNAQKYERSDKRANGRAGHYQRNFHTKAGDVQLNIPKLRYAKFETAIIERYKRRESSVEESLMEMYLAGVSVRRVEDVTQALWGIKVSAGTVSDLNQKMYERIEAWRNEKITGQYPYVYLDGISLKRTWGGEVRNVAILVAVGVGQDGYRDILGVAEGCKEDKAGWSSFLAYLKRRGLTCPDLFISDKCIGLIESLAEYYPEAKWQRCTVHWYCNVLSVVPRGKMKEVAAMLKAIHAQEDAGAARIKAAAVAEKLETMKLYKAAEKVRQGINETLSYHDFPREHHRHIYTNNPQENIMKQIRRRTRVVGAFPDGNSALMLAAARLRHIAGTQWGLKRYMNMERLTELKREHSEKLTVVAG